jgi:hypothetical protein
MRFLHPVHAKVGTTNYRVVYCTESVYVKAMTDKLKVGDKFPFRYEKSFNSRKIVGIVTQIRSEHSNLMISL